MSEIKLLLTKDKTTPGTVRFKDMATDDHPISIYLTKEQVKELGVDDKVIATLSKPE